MLRLHIDGFLGASHFFGIDGIINDPEDLPLAAIQSHFGDGPPRINGKAVLPVGVAN